MAKDVIHTAAAEAASDCASLMVRARVGAEAVAENGEQAH
jgi:hypothetical protein